ncbi:MAG: DUF2065 domain-containing protein [Thiobacillaceae bacterium]|jgi:uncharacterized protein YjeT (DUF2065 family)
MTGDWMVAFALVLVLEGILPLAAPTFWRDAIRRATELSDGQLRFMGAISMASGLALIVLLK